MDHYLNGRPWTILDILSFKRKRFPDGRLLKHKTRPCAHGGMQKRGINYWETYAPVVNWIRVQTLLAITNIYKLGSRSIDFVLAFTQADFDVNVYKELPIGIYVPNGGTRDYFLKLNKYIYGLNQDNANWFETLKASLYSRDFEQSQVDPCVFLRKYAIVLVYVDDCIIVSKDSQTIKDLVISLKTGPENFS